VPDVVNTAMNQHGIGDMYVVQYETGKGDDPLLRPIPPGSVASLNTHDMPAFTAFWTGLDVDERVDLGLMDEADADAERTRRADVRRQIIDYLVENKALREPTRDPLAVQRAMLRLLGCSPAQVVFATLEDLWQEAEPQNTPGTFKERRNWQRKLRYSFEVFAELPDVKQLLADLKEARDKAAAGK
jgi:4-alpha-glucanotransferase